MEFFQMNPILQQSHQLFRQKVYNFWNRSNFETAASTWQNINASSSLSDAEDISEGYFHKEESLKRLGGIDSRNIFKQEGQNFLSNTFFLLHKSFF